MGKTYISSYNELDCLRGIAHKLGGNAASANQIDALRTIVTRLDAAPGNRTVGNMNEVDCLRAIVRHYATAEPIAFSPTDLDLLKLWLKADSLSLSDGDPIASWTDSSGLGNHAMQATEAKKPTYKVNIVNGKPVVRLDGVDDCVQATLTVAQPDTMFLVVKGDGTDNKHFIDAQTTRQLIGVSGGVQVTYAGTLLSGTGNPTTFQILAALFNGASSQLWRNGTSIASGNAGASSIVDPSVGGYGAATMGGDIAEVLIYSSLLSDSDRRAVEAYLGSKYGITVA